MKIAVLFETQTSGGGSFSHSINTCINLIKYNKKKHQYIVYTNFKKNYDQLNKLKIPCVYFKYNLIDKILIKISIISFIRFFLNFFEISLSIEKALLKNKVNFIYYPVISESIFFIKKIDFFLSFLDTEHFKYNIFPEISLNEFKKRENLYLYCLKKALFIIVSHESIKKDICKKYKISKKKVTLIPYTPSKIFNQKNKSFKIRTKLKNFKRYIFYPAQIWGHKNHISILKAAKILQEKNFKVQFVFSGLDRGYKGVLDEYIKSNNLKNIFFTGYLNSKEMDYVYKKSSGIIFTSLFGPDAIPPLEAWSYKKPLIYNNRFEDFVSSKTAITTDINNPLLISKAVIKIITKKYNNKLIRNGLKTLNLIEKKSSDGYQRLNKRIDEIKKN